MAKFNNARITELGRKLQAKVNAGETLVLTNLKTTDIAYSVNQIEKLTQLTGVKQTRAITSVDFLPPDAVNIVGFFDNTDITTGYYLRSIGVYANDPDDGEILFAVVSTDDNLADWFSPNNSLSAMAVEVEFLLIMANASQVVINTSAAGTVPIESFNAHVQNNLAHNATNNSNINTIMSRDESGYSKIKSPNYEDAEDEHIMNKKSTIEAIDNKTSNLATKTELGEKQDKLKAGTNIEITEDNTINATGGSSVKISQDIETDKLSTEKVPSVKAVYDFNNNSKNIVTGREIDMGFTIDGKKVYRYYASKGSQTINANNDIQSLNPELCPSIPPNSTILKVNWDICVIRDDNNTMSINPHFLDYCTLDRLDVYVKSGGFYTIAIKFTGTEKNLNFSVLQGSYIEYTKN